MLFVLKASLGLSQIEEQARQVLEKSVGPLLFFFFCFFLTKLTDPPVKVHS